MEAIRNLGLAGLLGLLITAVPMVAGVAFALRPRERLLELMRPLSLAGLFAAIANVFLGATYALLWLSRNTVTSVLDPRLVAGLADTAVLGFLSFAFLTVGWLAVAAGTRRLT